MKSFRVEKVGSELMQIVSDAIRNKLQDPRILPLTSVTRVEVTRDIERANVYVSVYGEKAEQNKTIAALKHARGHIQSLVAKRLKLRQCPQLVFHLDESLKKGHEVIQLINESMAELEAQAASRSQDAPEDLQSSEGPAE